MVTTIERRKEALVAAGAGVQARYDGLSIKVKQCYRTTKSAQGCRICSAANRQMHLPMGHVGHFCDRCCPVCSQE